MSILYKGQIVLVNEKYISYVLSGSKNVNLVTYDQTSDSLKIFKNLSSTSKSITVPPDLKMHPKLQERYNRDFMTVNKNDFVEFNDQQGVKQTGYVIRGGTQPTVIYSEGQYECKVPAHLCTVIEKPVILEEPSAMDDWSVVKYKEHKELSEETVAFSASIAYKGKVVFDVRNDGQGGSMSMSQHLFSDESSKLYDKFEKDILSWTKQFGLEGDAFEMDENWVMWYANDRPLGITAKVHFERYNKDMAPYLAMQKEREAAEVLAKEKKQQGNTEIKPSSEKSGIKIKP